MGRSCYTSAGAYVLEQRWQFRQQLEQDQQLGVVHRAAVFPSQAEKTGYMSDPVGMVLLDRLSYLLEFGY